MAWVRKTSINLSAIEGDDARIILGADEGALIELWQKKRGELGCDTSACDDLGAHLSFATKNLNRHWYERNSGRKVVTVRRQIRHSAIPWMVASLDGMIEGTGAIFEAKFILSRASTEEMVGHEPSIVKDHMASLQHKMWVTHARSSVLSIFTGDGRWLEVTVPLDPLYLTILVPAEKKFWRCVQSGERPHLTYREVPRAAASSPVRIVDMSGSSAWAELARVYRVTHNAVMANEKAKRALAALIPAHADQAIGHGVQARRIAGALPQFQLNRAPTRHTPNSYQRRSLARRSSWAARPLGSGKATYHPSDKPDRI